MNRMARLLCHPVRRRKRLRAIIARIVDRRSSHLVESVATIERKLAPPPIEQRQLAVAVAVALTLMVAASGVCYFYLEHRDRIFLLGYAAYALPAMAAVYVGLGLFVGLERVWFSVSAVMVALGFIAFLASNGSLHGVIWLFAGFGGIACAFSLLPVFIKRTAGEKMTTAYRIKLALGYLLSVPAYLAGIYILVVMLGLAPPPPPPKPATPTVTCVDIGKDAVGHRLLHCDEIPHS